MESGVAAVGKLVYSQDRSGVCKTVQDGGRYYYRCVKRRICSDKRNSNGIFGHMQDH